MVLQAALRAGPQDHSCLAKCYQLVDIAVGWIISKVCHYIIKHNHNV